MSPTAGFLLLLVVFLLLHRLPGSLSAHVDGRRPSNITVIGTVFCDICSNNTFTKHSYFLQGAKVQVECSFKANSTTREEMSITVDRTTDRLGIYRIDIPPVDGLECRQGRQLESFCRARLLHSSSSFCNVPGLSTSAEHQALKFSHSTTSLCVYNLNALNYRPPKKDAALCGTARDSRGQTDHQTTTTVETSLFFWPPFPPFTPPWPFSFPFPFPFPQWPFPFPYYPTPFPFPLPFTTPSPAPTFPFPFFAPPPPAFPFPFPPLGPAPQIPFWFSPPPPPPAFPFPPLPPLTPIPNPFTPSPPPPSPPPPMFPFPPLGPIPNPFTTTPSPPPPPPPSPPPPSFPFPFPPFPPFQSSPPPPLPPPPSQPFWNPKSWFPPPSPSPP